MVKKVLKFVVPTLLLGFLVFNIAQDWPNILPYIGKLNVVPLFLSFIVLLTVYPQGAFGWYLILKNNNIKTKPYEAVRIWIISNTARYIPGKVWQYVGRVEMARDAGIARNFAISSLLLEIFLVLLAGLCVSILALPFINLGNFHISYWVFLVAVPLILIHPTVSNWFIELIAKFTKKEIKKFALTLSFGSTLNILIWFSINFLLNGLALSFLIKALGREVGIMDFFMYSGFYSISWVLGFVSLIAPAGVGVSEVSLAYLLSLSGVPLTLASAIALIYRFLITVAEILVFLFVLKFTGNKHDES